MPRLAALVVTATRRSSRPDDTKPDHTAATLTRARPEEPALVRVWRDDQLAGVLRARFSGAGFGAGAALVATSAAHSGHYCCRPLNRPRNRRSAVEHDGHTV
jgi:hypothetical protein